MVFLGKRNLRPPCRRRKASFKAHIAWTDPGGDGETDQLGNSVTAREECEAFFEAPLAALFYGKSSSDQEKGQHTEEVAVIENMLDSANIQTRKCALDMLKILITASPDP